MSDEPKRILLVDDHPDIHQDIRKILTAHKEDVSFEHLKESIFPDAQVQQNPKIDTIDYVIDSVYQGKEALVYVKKALANNQPYALAFIDVRMPPGWDGIETIKQIWRADPNIQMVICTAYADYSWKEMFNKLEGSHNFLILKKPFDAIEIRQLASALTKKWELNRRVLMQINTLEETVKKRTLELVRAKEIAEQANRFKSDFLENLSHELLTPLTSIIGFAQLINDDLLKPEQYKEYCGYILFSANYLAQMINEILNIASIDSDNMEFKYESIDLGSLLNEVKNMHYEPILNKHLEFNIHIPSSINKITTDSSKLKQILFNLVANAIKFTSIGGKIEIHIENIDNEQLRIEVIDTGIGIRKEDLNKLFVAFQQLDLSTSKRYPGIGLGLALVKHLVESQGGQVGVTSTYGKGSNFYVVLPCTPKR